MNIILKNRPILILEKPLVKGRWFHQSTITGSYDIDFRSIGKTNREYNRRDTEYERLLSKLFSILRRDNMYLISKQRHKHLLEDEQQRDLRLRLVKAREENQIDNILVPTHEQSINRQRASQYLRKGSNDIRLKLKYKPDENGSGLGDKLEIIRTKVEHDISSKLVNELDITSIIRSEHPELKANNSDNSVNSVKIDELENYLRQENKIAKQANFVQEQISKKYDWSQLYDVEKSEYHNHKKATPKTTPKDFLIYNLAEKNILRIVDPNEEHKTLFNINRKDLFAIINNTIISPDEALLCIQQVEKEGWKLIGDLYGQEEGLLVFEKPSEKAKKRAVHELKTLFISASVVTLAMTCALLL